jgi:hypothetical protein
MANFLNGIAESQPWAKLRWQDYRTMRRGYYMPNRGSVHCRRHQCPHWRRCEQDFGGVVQV